MPWKVFGDKLLDLCECHAEKIAEQWYKSVSTNSRTPSYHSLPKEACLPQVVFFYKNLKDLYFTTDSYQQVLKLLERIRYAEDAYARGIPLHEALYALIIMRRHIWLYAEVQATFNAASEMYQAVESINRTLLLFDYATYIVAQKYCEMTK